jgi:hypothetical protein
LRFWLLFVKKNLTADAENVQHILEDKLPHFVGSFMLLCELFICQRWQQFVFHFLQASWAILINSVFDKFPQTRMLHVKYGDRGGQRPHSAVLSPKNSEVKCVRSVDCPPFMLKPAVPYIPTEK